MSAEPHPLWAQVRRALRHEWNPIGFDGLPDDEYDGYAWPVIGKVMRGESVEQIADYLDWAAVEHIGCPQPRSRSLEVALLLARLRPP